MDVHFAIVYIANLLGIKRIEWGKGIGQEKCLSIVYDEIAV